MSAVTGTEVSNVVVMQPRTRRNLRKMGQKKALTAFEKSFELWSRDVR